MAVPLQILYPNGQVEAVQVYIWDPIGLQPIIWTGAVTGGGGGGGAVTIVDGGNVVEGATTDAAVTGDNPGTISAKLRGLSKILFDVWNSATHVLRVDGSGVTQPTNLTQVGGAAVSLGAKTSANSIPVVLATDEATLPVSVSGSVTANQGTPAVIGNSWFTKISDGANGPVTVKLANVPPTVNDLALVVTSNPLTPSPLNSQFALAVNLSSLGATSLLNLQLGSPANSPSSQINVVITTLGNSLNNVVFEAQCADAVFRQMPLLALNGSSAGQWIDGSSLSQGIVYSFNTSGFSGVRLRVTNYVSSSITGDWFWSPQGLTQNRVVQPAFGTISSAPSLFPSGLQSLSLTTDSKLRAETSPVEYVDFFGDFDLLSDSDSLGVPNFSSTSIDIGF